MPFGFLRRMLGEGTRRAADPPPDPLAEAADRFAGWATRHLNRTINVDCAHTDVLDELGTVTQPDAPERLLDDAAAFLGEAARRDHGGTWAEDPILGLVLEGSGGVGGLRLRPYDVLVKKRELGPRLRVHDFMVRIRARIEAERQYALPPGWEPSLAAVSARLVVGGVLDESTAKLREAFTVRWRARFGESLPPSLRGLAAVDGWIRSNYLVCRVDAVDVVGAGLLAGEVARGLYGGTWQVAPGDGIERLALCWPELSYYPVGRVLRMVTEMPEAGGLEEYVRLVPSARKEMRERQPEG